MMRRFLNWCISSAFSTTSIALQMLWESIWSRGWTASSHEPDLKMRLPDLRMGTEERWPETAALDSRGSLTRLGQ